MAIEKDIPIPPRHKAGGRPPKTCIGELQVGDSVFVPETRPSVWYWKVKLGANYVTRMRTESGIYGCRVWRQA